MKNILLDISYDGRNYVGWQIQPNGLSIEETLINSLDKLKIDHKNLVSSGRTDAGVNALHQKVNFFTNSNIPAERIKYALNTVLPKDIRILSSEEVSDDFHARYSAVGKHYTYYVNLNKIANPFEDQYSWNYTYPIDLKLLEEICSILEGEHDFKSFMKKGSSVKTTVRNLYKIKPTIEKNMLKLDFIGNGFLYNMVRILTGTILQYSSEQLKDFNSNEVFNNPNRSLVGITAPANGLFLSEVFYDNKSLEEAIEKLDLL